MHFFADRVLFIDIDVSKRRNFDAVIYHLKSKVDVNKSKRINIEFIFFNRMLNEAKKNYWLTKLKMMNLIWVIRRLRHMIEIVKHVTVIFTNHNVNIFIIKQTIFFNNNIDKLNFRLMRTFIYLSQFQLKVKYQLDKNYIVSNALFRLFFDNEQIDNVNVNVTTIVL